MSTQLSAVNSSDIRTGSVRIKTTKAPRGAYPYYNPTELIPNECEILWIDPKTEEEQVRLIRYVRGMKNIFVDEWSDAEKKKRGKKIKLTDGHLDVSTRDKNLLQFLRLAGYNRANKDTRMPDTSVLYEIFDYEAKAKEVVEERNRMKEAENFVSTAPIEEVRAFALALCKNKAEADSTMVEAEFTLRYKMQNLAAKDPNKFIDIMKSDSMKNKVYIHRALTQGVISMTNDSKGLTFPNEMESFCVAPDGMSVVEWFADLSGKNDKYIKILETIKEMLDVKEPEPAKEQLSFQEQIFNNALESGKLEKTNNWYSVPGEEGKDPIVKFNGRPATLEAIKTNKDQILSYIV